MSIVTNRLVTLSIEEAVREAIREVEAARNWFSAATPETLDAAILGLNAAEMKLRSVLLLARQVRGRAAG